jgi:DNA-binding CsgD family transcriptional regulator
MELLSNPADALYERLIKADGLALGGEPEQVASDDPALAELYRHGLAWSSADRVVRPVFPDLTLGRLFVTRQREVLDLHRDLLADYARLTELARANGQCGREGSRYLEILDSPTRVTAAIHELQGGALVRYQALDVPWLLAAEPRAAGPRCRLIRSRASLDTDPPPTTMPWRIGIEVPMRLLIADDTGLVLLTSPGSEAGALIRAPAAVDALIHYFDLLWATAIAVSTNAPADTDASAPSGPVTPVERAILGLMMAGTTDATIARTLGISPRSVRRHVAALEERAGVTNRFALGAAAARLDWLADQPLAS